MSDIVAPLVTPQRLILAASVLLAVAVPTWLLMPPKAPEIGDQPPLTLTRFELAPSEDPTAALEHPLFNASRSSLPPAEFASSTEAVAVEAPTPTLVGLITGRKTAGLALVRSADGQTSIAHVGDMVDGWQMIAITRSGATFRQGSNEHRVELDYGNRPSNSGAQPAPPPSLPTGS